MAIIYPPAHDAAPIDQKNGQPAFPSSSMTGGQPGTANIAVGAARPLTDRQIALLEGRGINVELAARMGWRSAKHAGISESIDIPYYRDGVEVNCKTRTLEGEKKFYQVEGGEKILWNLEAIKTLGDAPLVICEGEMDAMIALQCGFMAVSVPDGAPKSAIGDKESQKYDYLVDIPQSVEKIILATDGDNPGINLMQDLALRLGRHRCWWVRYPLGCKDLNDAYRAYGAKGVMETLTRAQEIKIDGLYRMNDLPPLPEMPALAVGIRGLEDHLRLRQGDFSVVTGIPSHGKSTFVNNIAVNMAKMHGWHVCFASFEQAPQTEHKRALRTLYHGFPEWKQSPEQKIIADKWINENFSFIVPNDESDDWADMEWLKERMAAAVKRYNAKLIVIDPWNEMDHMFDQRNMSLTQYVGTAIKELKRFARRYMAHVMVVAHPAKMRKDKSGDYPIPTAYDISDSAHWYNKPEQVIVVHREDDSSLIRIAKSRYHNILGKPADVKMAYNEFNGQYKLVNPILDFEGDE